VAQLGARFDGIEEVAGSNPAGSTKLSSTFLIVRSAPVWAMAESRSFVIKVRAILGSAERSLD
jgi:hypothetical protein